MCVCVYLCESVCVREGERERDRDRGVCKEEKRISRLMHFCGQKLSFHLALTNLMTAY